MISDGHDEVVLGRREVPARAYASWFNFRGSDQQKLVKDLSGGERNRVQVIAQHAGADAAAVVAIAHEEGHTFSPASWSRHLRG